MPDKPGALGLHAKQLSEWCQRAQVVLVNGQRETNGLVRLCCLVCVAEEAAADAKQRAKEAREWIDNWKSKQ